MIKGLTIDVSGSGHRIVVETTDGIVCGEWFHYNVPSVLRCEGRLFMAFTNYWNGEYPTDKVLECQFAPESDVVITSRIVPQFREWRGL